MSQSPARKARRHGKKPDADAALVAYLHPGMVSHSFTESLMRLVGYDMANHGRVIRSGGPVMFRCGPGGLVEARNKVMAHFLDGTDVPWLWMVDSDMGFAPDTIDRLIDAADPAERPVIGGLCFGLKESAPDGMGGFKVRAFPTLYDWAAKPDGETGFHIRRDYTENSVTQVAGTGAACLLVHRAAAEKVRAEHGDTWFNRTAYPSGQPVSEDLSFCWRLGTVGLPVFVHTGVKTTHHKQFWVGEDEYRLFEAAWRADG